MLRTVDADADRLTRLIAELLDVARIDSGRLVDPQGAGRPRRRRSRSQLEPLNIASRRGSSCSTADGRARASGSTATSSPRSLANLVENAVQHGDGDVDGHGHRAGGPTAALSCSSTTRATGIADEIRPRVFTKFWKHGSRGGSGLGLYIVGGLVEAHDGVGARRGLPGTAAPGCGSCSRTASHRPSTDVVMTSLRRTTATTSTAERSDCQPSPSRQIRRHSTGQTSARRRAYRFAVEARCFLDSAGGARSRRVRRPPQAEEWARRYVRPQQELRPGRGHAAARRRGRRHAATRRSPRSRRPPTSTRSRRSGWRTPATARRWPWPTARSARCRRRPARRPGKRIGQARGAVNQALAPAYRRARGRARGRGCSSRRPSTSRCPTTATPRGARHPLTTLHGADRRRLRRDGLRGRRGSRGRGRVVQLRRAQHAARTTRRARCRTRSSSSPRTPASCCAPTPRRCRSARMLTPRPADLRRSARAGSTAPTSSTRRTRRSSTRSRGWPSTRA